MVNNYLQHKHHTVAVDCAIFGYEQETLKLLLFKRTIAPQQGDWSLVGGWVNENESVESAAYRVLHKISGLSDIYMEQVEVFSEPDRDPGGHVISVVFNAFIDIQKHNPALINEHDARWWPVNQLPNLVFDHYLMFRKALLKLQQKASNTIIGNELLPEEFTLTQLRKLYNSIFMREFDPGNFRKKIISLQALERTNRKDTSESKKGAYYYRFKPENHGFISQQIVKI